MSASSLHGACREQPLCGDFDWVTNFYEDNINTIARENNAPLLRAGLSITRIGGSNPRCQQSL